MNKILFYKPFVLYFILLFSCSYLIADDMSWVKKVGARKLPLSNRVFNVNDFGAIGDGVTLCTKSIQKAIDECNKQGGGKVVFNPGKYLVGSLFLKSNVHLEIPKYATLLGSEDLVDYKEIETRVAGIEMMWPAAIINALGVKNVLISGEGKIDGQGKVFWDKYWSLRKDYESKGLRWIVDYDCKRPRTLLVSESEDVTIKDLTFQRSGFWTIHILYSSYCTVDGVVIQNNIGGFGPSTDGIDIDSSSYILVENSDIDCNDDNFCIKSGRDADGLRVNRPTEYVVIRNNVSRAGGGLFTIGSETSGGARYILAENIKAKGTKVGLRFKSALNRGGTVEHIYIRNVQLEDVGVVFEATNNWNPSYSYSELPKEFKGRELPIHWQKMLEKVDPQLGLPFFKNINVTNVKVNNARAFFNVGGSEKSPMQDFSFENIQANVDGVGAIDYAYNWVFENVNINANDFKELEFNNSKNIKIKPKNIDKSLNLIHKLPGINKESHIAAYENVEFSFLLPELSGTLKFGFVLGDKSVWLNEDDLNIDYNLISETRLNYMIKGSLLNKGKLYFDVVKLSNTDGVIIKVDAENIPPDLQLVWIYGGASKTRVSLNGRSLLLPQYCPNNVFSLLQSKFTLYYGQTMNFSVIEGIAPVTSEIEIKDAFYQDTPLQTLNSNKNTSAPLLTGVLPLSTGKSEYFAIYKPNRNSDYAYYLLPDLFEKEKK